MTTEEKARNLASMLLAGVQTDDDWRVISRLADILRNEAWNHSVRHMLTSRERMARIFYRGLRRNDG